MRDATGRGEAVGPGVALALGAPVAVLLTACEGVAGRGVAGPTAARERAQLVQRADRLLALLGLLRRELLGPELDRSVLGVDEYGVALLVFAGEHLLGERIEDQLLDRAPDG